MSEQIKSRPLSREGRDNYDSIFRKEVKVEHEVRAEDLPPRDGLENVDMEAPNA